ncbi:MAG TPA: sulfocyanin-like copper-binding protein [Candidatus Limnocylindria bacterium]
MTFNVTNAGTMVHEFVILKTDTLAKDLPLVNGVVVEDDFSPVGEVPETAAGKSGTFSATLAAGHYAIICNLAGHVAQGMVIDFTVN